MALVESLVTSGREHDQVQDDRDQRYRNLEVDTGRLLHLLVGLHGASRVLEVGTSNGVSTIWLADALPEGGSLVSVENDEGRHREAVQNLATAGLSGRVELMLGDAGDVLRGTWEDSVDLVFLDADRSAYVSYWPEVQRILRPGGLLAVDNCTSHADEVADFIALVEQTSGVEQVMVPIGAGLLLATMPRD